MDPQTPARAGATTCWSKSSTDLKQLCAVEHYILIVGGVETVKNTLFAVKHGFAYAVRGTTGYP